MKPITPDQKKQFVRMGGDVLNGAMEIAISQLEEDREISSDGIQRVLGKGNKLRPKLIQFMKGAILELAEEVKPYLKRISGGKKVSIGASDGKDTLAKAQDVFKAWVDDDFENWDLDIPGEPTEETDVEVHELVRDGTFANIYASTETELESLCLSQAQIKKFCKESPDWLRTEGYGTFFLFKKNKKLPASLENLFVARVDVLGDGQLGVGAVRFSYGLVWSCEYRHRFVLPQLA